MASLKILTDLDKILKTKVYPAFLAEHKTSHKTGATTKGPWARGTGYGSGGNTGSWEEIEKRSKEKERETDLQFEALNDLVVFIQTIPPSKRKILADGISASRLPQIMCTLLIDDSFTSLAQQAQVYFSLFQIMAMLSIDENLARILYEPTPNCSNVIFDQFKRTKEASDVFLGLQASSSSGSTREMDDEAKAASKENSLLLAEKIKTLFGHLDELYEEHFSEYARTGKRKLSRESLEQLYKERMKPLQFRQTDNSSQFRARHVLTSTFSGMSGMPDMRRIMNEISSLHSALPLDFASSVFVCIDTASTQLLKALIVGPSDTPYEAGLFEFDILYPSTYPRDPPKVQIVTTGGGTFRFNPNLYSNGKVCLSLLGTWSGDSGEQWNPRHSTLIQVLISIQALILVDQPYFNEPGYERDIGTERGEEASRRYNDPVRRHTVKLAMIDQIEKAKANRSEFSEVILKHFALQKERVMRVVEQWKRDTGIDTHDYDKLRTLLNSLDPN